MSMNQDFKLISLNVKGLCNKRKRTGVFRWLKRVNMDIAFIQEAHCTKETEMVWDREWEGKVIYAHGTSNSRGCLILLRDKLDYEIISLKTDVCGRYIILCTEINETIFFFINVYLPNTENEQLPFLSNLLNILKEYNLTNEDNIIMGGDWNIVRNLAMDKSGGLNISKDKSNEKLNEIMSIFELSDTWRIKYPTTK